MALRILLMIGWLMLPGAGFAYHYLGPGKEQRKLDAAAEHIRAAERAAAEGDYALAIEEYDEALKLLPDDHKAEARKLRLEKAKAQMLANALPEAHADLKSLVDDMQDNPGADANLLADARSVMANSQYYMTWLMRLEGHGRDAWEPEIESARQTYKLLAEQAEKSRDSAAALK
ncbi:MAG TPA: hypothetical protein VKE74_05260, partial [Gemmataceae bacterium]|nr:hypothetical protein [Gemmataceae bacterium]